MVPERLAVAISAAGRAAETTHKMRVDNYRCLLCEMRCHQKTKSGLQAGGQCCTCADIQTDNQLLIHAL